VELSRRWPSGDEIHLGDAVDYMIELLRGASPEENIYFRKVTNHRDIVAAVVLDASSSTDEEVGGRRIIDVEKSALSILASALSRIGDDFGVFSYFSLGRHKVFFEIVKDFNEPWDERTQGRIGSIRAQAANRDGCVIRHAAARLAEQPHATKLLLLLSDGVPADVGYGGESSAEASPYGIEDTRRAVLECKRLGIVPYCITIDRAARDYIAHLYGDFHYTVIDDVAQLPERLSRFYLRFTG
jgi:nitric oxide reductase NorD protein